MLVIPGDVILFNLRQNAEVPASLIRLTRDLAADRIDGEWWNLEVSRRLRAREVDHHWRWRQIVGSHRSNRSWETLAVASAGGAIEGAIAYRIDALSRIESGVGTVYIDFELPSARAVAWLDEGGYL